MLILKRQNIWFFHYQLESFHYSHCLLIIILLFIVSYEVIHKNSSVWITLTWITFEVEIPLKNL